MNTESDDGSGSFQQALTDQLERILLALPEDQRLPFAAVVETCQRQSKLITLSSTDPQGDLLWPVLVTLLAYCSTQAGTPGEAVALANAARAFAAVFVAENQVAAFRSELERVGE